MHVAVGSENPVKVAAVERCLPAAAVTAVGVDSGVSEQPRGREETVEGARNRAVAALNDTEASLGVGIEGGVTDRSPPAGLWLIMWAAITDGERTEYGAGPTLRLPADLADRVRDGEELGPVLGDRLDRTAVNEQEGAVGVFTGGTLTRAEALASAVACALGPFETDAY